VEPLGPLLNPLPELLPIPERFIRSRERDTAYIRSTGQPVLLVGRDPLLSQVREDLIGAGITIGEEVVLPDVDPTPRGVFKQLTHGKSGIVVVATTDAIEAVRHLTILDRFNSALASFALARTASG
jgi:hypothetical protein